MQLSLVTAPSTDPITVAEVVANSRLDTSGSPPLPVDNTLVQTMIKAATTAVDGKDGWLNRALVSQTWKLYLDKFPSSNRDTKYEDVNRKNGIILPLPPVQSVTHIKYKDTSGTLQTLSASLYSLSNMKDPGIIVPVYGQTWPETQDVIEAVEIQFVAGYGAETAVPKAIKQALLMMVEEMYNNRGETVLSPMIKETNAVGKLLSQFRNHERMF